MPGASSTLDPVEAARADIAQSRDLIASASHDLHRTQRWFDSYQLAEKRHGRRLRRQELLYRLELRRQQVARFSKWTALTAARDARDTYRTLYAASVVTLHFLQRNASAASAWAAPKLRTAWLWLDVQARRIWLACLDAGTVAGTWTAAQMRALAHRLALATSQAWAWTMRQAPIVSYRITTTASAGFAWTQTKLRALGRSLRDIFSFVWAWLRVELNAVALATGSTASAAATWSARKGRRSAVPAIKLSRRTRAAGTAAGDATRAAAASSAVLLARATAASIALRDRFGIWPARAAAECSCRALAVRRSTALVCVTPVHAQLPALRIETPEVRRPPRARPPRRSKPKPNSTAKPKTKAKAKPKTKSKARPKRKAASTRRRPRKRIS
jgi:hypothetical protein